MARSAKQIAALAKAQKASAAARKAKAKSNLSKSVGNFLDNPSKANASKVNRAAAKAPTPRKPRKTKLNKGIGSFLDNPTGKSKGKSKPKLPKPVKGGRATIDKYGVPRNQYGQPISATEYKKLHTLDARQAGIKSLMRGMNRK